MTNHRTSLLDCHLVLKIYCGMWIDAHMARPGSLSERLACFITVILIVILFFTGLHPYGIKVYEPKTFPFRHSEQILIGTLENC